MSELNRTERLQPSLLDRLTDLAPDQRKESYDQQALTGAQLRKAVLRDLGWLLNATNLDCADMLPDQSAIACSTLNYGIPGVAGSAAMEGRSIGLERQVAQAIRTYEPRIRPDSLQIRSRPAQRTEGLPVLVLEISGELWAQPVPQQIFLETAIELDTGVAVVTEAAKRRR